MFMIERLASSSDVYVYDRAAGVQQCHTSRHIRHAALVAAHLSIYPIPVLTQAALEKTRPACAVEAVAITQKPSPQHMWAIRGARASLSVLPASGISCACGVARGRAWVV